MFIVRENKETHWFFTNTKPTLEFLIFKMLNEKMQRMRIADLIVLI